MENKDQIDEYLNNMTPEQLKELSDRLKQENREEIHLENLISAEGLVPPQPVDGRLNLENLRSVENLVLPKQVGIESLDEKNDSHKPR